jgi:FkbM family methyltransferase
MNQFSNILDNIINKNIYNNYKDNFDKYRFGEHKNNRFITIMKTLIFRNYTSNIEIERILERYNTIKTKYIIKLNELYNILQDEYSKIWMVDMIAYYILGYKKVKLLTNNPKYHELFKIVDNLRVGKDKIETNFLNFVLYNFDLNSIGYPINLYFRNAGIVHDFILEQYNYKGIIKAEKDDIVIDAGGCWGDTALYFANQVGINGKVHVFEFIPNNLNILCKNLDKNKELKKCISVIEKPIWSEDNIKTYFFDNGPASKVSFAEFNGYTNTVETISIDKYVQINDIKKVDFIKMDIEGAELPALIGATDTIKKFKPKLAIASYHGLDDFVNIPIWINNLNLGYKIHLDHFTIHWEETIIFASIE